MTGLVMTTDRVAFFGSLRIRGFFRNEPNGNLCGHSLDFKNSRNEPKPGCPPILWISRTPRSARVSRPRRPLKWLCRFGLCPRNAGSGASRRSSPKSDGVWRPAPIEDRTRASSMVDPGLPETKPISAMPMTTPRRCRGERERRCAKRSQFFRFVHISLSNKPASEAKRLDRRPCHPSGYRPFRDHSKSIVPGEPLLSKELLP